MPSARATGPVRPRPGLAFWIVSDLGFAVGLVTHIVPRQGSLVWIAGPVFEEPPDLAAVAGIVSWRWPVFFPLGAALRRRLVTGIGVTGIPPAVADMPRLRGGGGRFGWSEVSYQRDGRQTVIGPPRDPTMAVDIIVNDTRLKEMIVTGWRPERMW